MSLLILKKSKEKWVGRDMYSIEYLSGTVIGYMFKDIASDEIVYQHACLNLMNREILSELVMKLDEVGKMVFTEKGNGN